MEGAKPEVRLALSVERRLRRPAAQLRAALAAAERQVRDDTPAAALLAGDDPLAVLAALLDTPAAGRAQDPAPGRSRGLAPVAAVPGERRDFGAVGRSAASVAAPSGVSRGLAKDGAARHPPEPATAREAVRVVPMAAPPGAEAAVAAIAQARAALHHSVAGRPQAGTPAPLRDALDGSHGGDPAPPHALVAAAAATAAPPRDAASWAGGLASTGAIAPPAATHDRPASGMARVSPLAADVSSRDVPARPVLATPMPSLEVRPASARAPAPAVPAPRGLTGPRLGLDSGDALAEAAWRNGVDLS